MTSIGDFAFEGCSSLTDVYYSGSESDWEVIDIDDVFNDPLFNATIHYNCSGPEDPDVKNDYDTSTEEGRVITYTALAKIAYSKFDSSLGETVSEFVAEGKHNEMKSTMSVNKDWKNLIWSDKDVTYTKFYTDVIGDYEIVDVSNQNDRTGFYGVCFKSPDGNYIISYRGSEGSDLGTISNYMCTKLLNLALSENMVVDLRDDWSATDFEFALFNSLSEQFDCALDFYDKILAKAEQDNGAEIILTGHSLGGALAAYVSIATNAKAYCIDGAVGHVVDVSFADAYLNIDSFDGTENFNFINYTDADGDSIKNIIDVASKSVPVFWNFNLSFSEKWDKIVSDIVEYEKNKSHCTFVADLIQATNKDYYPMKQYRSSNIYKTTEQPEIFLAIAGSHHAMSYLSYDESTGRFKLNELVKSYNTKTPWSLDVSLSNVTKDRRVMLGTASDDTIYAPSNWLFDQTVSNIMFGGAGKDYLYGYLGNDVLSGEGSVNYLEGGSGDDTYIVDKSLTSGGSTIIKDPSGKDTLIFP